MGPAERAAGCASVMALMTVEFALFDVGGVIVFTPFELAARLERRRGLEPGTLELYGPFAPERDPEWGRILAGEIGETAYWRRHAQRLAPLLGLEGPDPTRALIAELFAGDETDVVRPELEAALDELQAHGIRTGVLSNHLTMFHRPDAIAGVLARFDPVIDLSDAAVRKPDPAAFTAAADRLGVTDPSRVLLVDDQPAHVAGARSAGLSAIRFDPTRPAESFEELVTLACR